MPSCSLRLAHSQVPNLTPLAAYDLLAARYGAEKIFLLESLAGPQQDRNMAIVGCDPLLSIAVQDHALRFSGRPALVAWLRGYIEAQGFTLTPKGCQLASRPDLWPLLRLIAAGFAIENPRAAPGYHFGYFGYFGYDAAHFIEKLPRRIADPQPEPQVFLSIYQAILRFDLTRQQCSAVTASCDLWPDALSHEDLCAFLTSAGPSAEPAPALPPAPPPLEVTDSITAPAYYAHVRQALAHIRLGDIYQVQIGHELKIHTEITPRTVYARLRQRNPAPYMFLAHLGGQDLVGASPEVFVKRQGDKVTMRPIAGTIARGETLEQEKANQARLRGDEKEVAEHVMLVDLCRNDLGRICRPGTLCVDEMLALERYSHVFHLVSNVTAELAAGYDAYDILTASFPAGTVTGTPKVRAMEIIENLETARRGVYAGAIGLIDFGGSMNMALCLRLASYRGGHFRIRASAGVVADSKPENEWRETLAKMASTYWAITGEEIASCARF